MLDVEGGWYATLRLPGTRSEDAWVLGFLEEDAVYVHPGHFFDFESTGGGHGHAIISLLTIEDDLREGVRRLAARVEAWA
ncbi:MAG: hypothetical protein JOZ69_04635 [Myxococcales bacterium]|nr:hypothetical protein [Myxococcales bacterium]